MRFEFCGLSGDCVALTLFQDLDSDGKMGKNVLGMPTEPWGASGSPRRIRPQLGQRQGARSTAATIIVRLSQ